MTLQSHDKSGILCPFWSSEKDESFFGGFRCSSLLMNKDKILLLHEVNGLSDENPSEASPSPRG